jgi:hypothetical protein
VTDEDKAKKLYEIGVEFGYIDKSVLSFEQLCGLAEADTSITISLDRRILGILALEVIDPFILNGLLENNRENFSLRSFSFAKLWRSFLALLGLAEKSKPTQPMNRSQKIALGSPDNAYKYGSDLCPSRPESLSVSEKQMSCREDPSLPQNIRITSGQQATGNRQPSPFKGQTQVHQPVHTPKEPPPPPEGPSHQDQRCTREQALQTKEETRVSFQAERPSSLPLPCTANKQSPSTETGESPIIQAKKYLFLAVNYTQFSNKFPSVVSQSSFRLSAEETKRLYNLPLFLLPSQGDETLNRIKSAMDNSISEGRVVLYVEPDNMIHFRKESPGSEKRDAFQTLAGKTISVLGVVASKHLDGLGLPFFAIN